MEFHASAIFKLTWYKEKFRDSLRRRLMAAKKVKLRPWTTGDIRMLKALARDGTKTSVIARELKRTPGATKQKAMRLGVSLGAR
jgi:hypothetical protein